VLVRQESRDRREIFRYWYAPEIGLVRRSKYFAGEEVFRQELVEFSVKPATLTCRQAEEREVRTAMAGKQRATSSGSGCGRPAGRPAGPDAPGYRSAEDRVNKLGQPR